MNNCIHPRKLCCPSQLGTTNLCNLINDPDVDQFRSIHIEIDKAAVEAYGWGDVSLGHGFHTYRQMTRWTIGPGARTELLGHLLEENHRRAALGSSI